MQSEIYMGLINVSQQLGPMLTQIGMAWQFFIKLSNIRLDENPFHSHLVALSVHRDVQRQQF